MILSIQLITYITFLISHFLVWGIWITCCAVPPNYYYFSGLDLDAGLISIILLNIGFIFSILLNFFFFFKLKNKEYHKIHAYTHFVTVILCSDTFLYSILEIFLFGKLGLLVHKLLYGFFLWSIPSIIIIIILWYEINIIYGRRSLAQHQWK